MMPATYDRLAVGDGVDIDLDRVLQIAVDQHRAGARDIAPRGACSGRARLRRGRSPSPARPAHRTAGSPPDSRCARPPPPPPRRRRRCRCRAGAGRACASRPWKRSRSSARSIASGEVPRIGISARSNAAASFSGVCPPNCTMTPSKVPRALLDAHDLEHVLGGQRLEIEPVGGVVIGRDGLRVAVDHDRLDAGSPRA